MKYCSVCGCKILTKGGFCTSKHCPIGNQAFQEKCAKYGLGGA